MTKRWPCVVVAMLCCLVALVTSSRADEPRGFLEWPWGTPKETIAKQPEAWCLHPDKEQEGKKQIPCSMYRVGDIRITNLILMFEPDNTLNGYTMTFSSGAMRRTVLEKFGPPTSSSKGQIPTPSGGSLPDEVLVWRWPSGTRAFYAEVCPTLGQSCFGVSSKVLSDLGRKKDEDEQKERKKGF